MASAARSGTSTLGLTSILPPRCIANTGSSSREDAEREKVASLATVNPQGSLLLVAGDAVLLAHGGGIAPLAGRMDGDHSRYGGCPLVQCAMSDLLLALSAPFCNTHERHQPITEVLPPQRGSRVDLSSYAELAVRLVNTASLGHEGGDLLASLGRAPRPGGRPRAPEPGHHARRPRRAPDAQGRVPRVLRGLLAGKRRGRGRAAEPASHPVPGAPAAFRPRRAAGA